MTEKKEEKKKFNPLAQAIEDAFDVHLFGSRHFNIERFCGINRKRGLVGMWTLRSLSEPLKLFAHASRDMDEDQTDKLLNGLATTTGVDANLIKRLFWALKQGWANQFLGDIEAQEEKRKKLEELVEEAESEAPEREETEEEENEEE
jgi:hypothetical protein